MKSFHVALIVGLLAIPAMVVGKEKANEKEAQEPKNLVFIAKFYDLNKTVINPPLIPVYDRSVEFPTLSPVETPFHRFVVCETIRSLYNLEGYISLFGIEDKEAIERGKPYLVVTNVPEGGNRKKLGQVSFIKLGVSLFPLPEFFDDLPYTGDCNSYFTE